MSSLYTIPFDLIHFNPFSARRLDELFHRAYVFSYLVLSLVPPPSSLNHPSNLRPVALRFSSDLPDVGRLHVCLPNDLSGHPPPALTSRVIIRAPGHLVESGVIAS